MQAVDVLGEKKPALPPALKASQGVMRVVGQRLPEPSPADHAACPVAAACGFLGDKSLKAHRLRSFPVAVAVAIIGMPEFVLQRAPVRTNRR